MDERSELGPDEKIVQEAKDRFKRVQDWEIQFRELYNVDVKFANGDSDNGWQWPDDLRKDREINKRPSLTINKTAQHVAQIVNDALAHDVTGQQRDIRTDASRDDGVILVCRGGRRKTRR